MAGGSRYPRALLQDPLDVDGDAGHDLVRRGRAPLPGSPRDALERPAEEVAQGRAAVGHRGQDLLEIDGRIRSEGFLYSRSSSCGPARKSSPEAPRNEERAGGLLRAAAAHRAGGVGRDLRSTISTSRPCANAPVTKRETKLLSASTTSSRARGIVPRAVAAEGEPEDESSRPESPAAPGAPPGPGAGGARSGRDHPDRHGYSRISRPVRCRKSRSRLGSGTLLTPDHLARLGQQLVQRSLRDNRPWSMMAKRWQSCSASSM